MILGKYGIVNESLGFFGIVEKPVRLMYTEGAIIVGLLQLFMPIMVLTLISAMENVQVEVEEAALSLGSSRLGCFFRVIIPLSYDGLIMGVMMPYVMKFNLMACPARYAAIAKAMGENISGLTEMDAAEKAVKAVQRLNSILDLPSLKNLGIEKNSFAGLSKIAMKNLGTIDNPRKMTETGFEEILNSAYDLP